MLSPRRYSRGRLQHVDMEMPGVIVAEMPVELKSLSQGAAEARTGAGADPAAAHAPASGWISRRLMTVRRTWRRRIRLDEGGRRTLEAWRGEARRAPDRRGAETREVSG